MITIPTKEQNPNGLHQKYYIQKLDGYEVVGRDFFEQPIIEPNYKPVDENAEYFVLRLDENGSDKNHIEACRKAVIMYAVNIEPYLPELAKDLIERYGRIKL